MRGTCTCRMAVVPATDGGEDVAAAEVSEASTTDTEPEVVPMDVIKRTADPLYAAAVLFTSHTAPFPLLRRLCDRAL